MATNADAVFKQRYMQHAFNLYRAGDFDFEISEDDVDRDLVNNLPLPGDVASAYGRLDEEEQDAILDMARHSRALLKNDTPGGPDPVGEDEVNVSREQIAEIARDLWAVRMLI